MPKPTGKINMYSNKGRKVHQKFTRLSLYCISYVDNDSETHPTREQCLRHGISLNLPSDMVGKVLACVFHADGNRVKDEDVINEDLNKVQETLFYRPIEHAVVHGKPIHA